MFLIFIDAVSLFSGYLFITLLFIFVIINQNVVDPFGGSVSAHSFAPAAPLANAFGTNFSNSSFAFGFVSFVLFFVYFILY